MLETTPAWETSLWNELDKLPPDQRIVVTGEYITHITHTLLTALSQYRWQAAADAVSQPGRDATSVAEAIGSRRTTIERMLAAHRRQRSVEEATAA